MAVGLSFDDEFPGGALEPVDCGLGEEWVGHDRQPLARIAVGGQHCGRVVVALDADLVDVGCLGGVERLEGKVVNKEQIDSDELAHFGVVAGVESCRFESFVEFDIEIVSSLVFKS